MDKQDYYIDDFDEWASLAIADPDAFEKMRQTLIDHFIESAPQEQRERLRCLQWRIDQERSLARTPMGACIRLSRMMWCKVFDRGGLSENLEQLVEVVQNGPQEIRTACILEFPERSAE